MLEIRILWLQMGHLILLREQNDTMFWYHLNDLSSR